MKFSIPTLCLASCALLSGGCLQTDTAVVRTSRPSMANFNRTTEPTETQVLDLVAAEQAGEAGEYADAIKLFEALLAQNPTLTDAYLGLGSVQLESGQLKPAERSYSRAARLEPGSFDAQFGHGTVLEALRKYSEAVRAYQRALAIRPTSVVANVGAAKTLIALGRPEAAVSFAKTAAKLEPEDMAIRVGLADSLEASGQYALAVKELEIAIELGEMTEDILFRMVNGYIKTKRWQEAANTAEVLVKIAPSAPAYERLGRAFYYMGDAEASLEAYQDAIKIDPNHWPSLNGLGVNALKAWLRSDRTDLEMANIARSALQQSLRTNPDQPKVIEILATYSL
jgi:tetratricopeptide (TPR) repeat protein